MRRNIVLGMCNASHGRFLLLCPVLVNIKGGSVLVESVLEVSNSSQDEPNHPSCCFHWQRCVSFIVCSFLILFAKLTIALLPLYKTDNEVSGCRRRLWGSQSFFLLLQVLLPRPCRLLPFVTFPTPPWPPALVERGDLSTWMAWTQKEQSSRQDSRFQIQDSREKMKENPRWWRREGERAGSSSTGSPPPPDPPPPPSQPPSPCQVSYAHRLEQPSVRFERLNFEYFLLWSICLTDIILLCIISIHV